MGVVLDEVDTYCPVELPWRAFQFCLETLHPLIVDRIKVYPPAELCQLWDLENAEVYKLPLAVQDRTDSGHDWHAREVQ